MVNQQRIKSSRAVAWFCEPPCKTCRQEFQADQTFDLFLCAPRAYNWSSSSLGGDEGLEGETTPTSIAHHTYAECLSGCRKDRMGNSAQSLLLSVVVGCSYRIVLRSHRRHQQHHPCRQKQAQHHHGLLRPDGISVHPGLVGAHPIGVHATTRLNFRLGNSLGNSLQLLLPAEKR